jgi:hypothetical protein
MINDANADKDAITGLRAPTNFGRPNWGAVFRSIRKIHSPGDCGVFFCGPKPLGSTLHIKCNEFTDPGKFETFHICHGRAAANSEYRFLVRLGQGEFLNFGKRGGLGTSIYIALALAEIHNFSRHWKISNRGFDFR